MDAGDLGELATALASLGRTTFNIRLDACPSATSDRAQVAADPVATGPSAASFSFKRGGKAPELFGCELVVGADARPVDRRRALCRVLVLEVDLPNELRRRSRANLRGARRPFVPESFLTVFYEGLPEIARQRAPERPRAIEVGGRD
jgi:hypothetical protein